MSNADIEFCDIAVRNHAVDIVKLESQAPQRLPS